MHGIRGVGIVLTFKPATGGATALRARLEPFQYTAFVDFLALQTVDLSDAIPAEVLGFA